MSKQESDSAAPKSSLDEFTDQCAVLCERVLAGEITWEQAADELFGPEPEVTYVHWSA